MDSKAWQLSAYTEVVYTWSDEHVGHFFVLLLNFTSVNFTLV